MKRPHLVLPSVALALAAIPASGQSTTSVQQSGADTYVQMQQQGPNNSTDVLQQGSGLSANISIQGQGNGSGPLEGLVEQSGEGSAATVNVFGDDNEFVVRQTGGNGPANNVATVDITGSNNKALIDQLNTLGPEFGNSAYISQAGGYNTASIRQAAAATAVAATDPNNRAEIFQNGYGNTAEIDQHGTQNQATIYQDGNGFTGSITQQGSGSSYSISQTGPADYNSYVVTQTGCLIGTGCGTVQILQGAAALTAFD